MKSISSFISAFAQWLKITEKVAFNIASEASYVYIWSGQKFIKNAKNGRFWVFEKCDIFSNFQTLWLLWDSILILCILCHVAFQRASSNYYANQVTLHEKCHVTFNCGSRGQVQLWKKKLSTSWELLNSFTNKVKTLKFENHFFRNRKDILRYACSLTFCSKINLNFLWSEILLQRYVFFAFFAMFWTWTTSNDSKFWSKNI